MSTTASSGKSGAAPSAESSLPSQVTELFTLLAQMDAWLSNDDGLMIEDVVEWREGLAQVLGVEPDSWFKRSGR